MRTASWLPSVVDDGEPQRVVPIVDRWPAAFVQIGTLEQRSKTSCSRPLHLDDGKGKRSCRLGICCVVGVIRVAAQYQLWRAVFVLG